MELDPKDCCFCWVRTLDAKSAADKATEEVSIRAGDRPPLVEALGVAPTRSTAAPRHFWFLDDEYYGAPQAHCVLDYGPAFHSRSDAMAWLVSAPGQSFVRHCQNYFLMVFGTSLDSTAPRAATLLSAADRALQNAPPSDWQKFPLADWAPQFLSLGLQAPQLRVLPAFDFAALTLSYPVGQPLEQECEQLRQLISKRPTLAGQIRNEAQSDRHAIQPVLDVLGLNYDLPPRPACITLRRDIQDVIWHAVFVFKRVADRARPLAVCQDLDPLFQRPDRLYPGHPAFPSGHATMAYTWAYLLANLVGQKQAELEQAAARVAWHREVAGVHFPSDSEAGRQLGQQLANEMQRQWPDAELKKLL